MEPDMFAATCGIARRIENTLVHRRARLCAVSEVDANGNEVVGLLFHGITLRMPLLLRVILERGSHTASISYRYEEYREIRGNWSYQCIFTITMWTPVMMQHQVILNNTIENFQLLEFLEGFSGRGVIDPVARQYFRNRQPIEAAEAQMNRDHPYGPE